MKMRRRSSLRCSTSVITVGRRASAARRRSMVVGSHGGGAEGMSSALAGSRSAGVRESSALELASACDLGRRARHVGASGLGRRHRLGQQLARAMRGSTRIDSSTSVDALRNSRIVLPSALPTSGSLPGPRISSARTEDEQQFERADIEWHAGRC